MRSLFLCFLVLSLFTACSPEEETPEKLILGNYRLNKSESLSFINDSIAIHYFFLNDEKCEDTLGYEYRAPLNIVNVVNTGDVFFKTLINPSTELSIYSRNFNYDETHLYHTIRYGSDMLLPNPESTDFCYVLSDE